jgi:hypothetical protein
MPVSLGFLHLTEVNPYSHCDAAATDATRVSYIRAFDYGLA